MPFKNPQSKKQYDQQYYQRHRYQLLGETPNHFQVQHPDGSIFRVAKAGLSPDTIGKIQGFACGGKVKKPIRAADGVGLTEQGEVIDATGTPVSNIPNNSGDLYSADLAKNAVSRAEDEAAAAEEAQKLDVSPDTMRAGLSRIADASGDEGDLRAGIQRVTSSSPPLPKTAAEEVEAEATGYSGEPVHGGVPNNLRPVTMDTSNIKQPGLITRAGIAASTLADKAELPDIVEMDNKKMLAAATLAAVGLGPTVVPATAGLLPFLAGPATGFIYNTLPGADNSPNAKKPVPPEQDFNPKAKKDIDTLRLLASGAGGGGGAPWVPPISPLDLPSLSTAGIKHEIDEQRIMGGLKEQAMNREAGILEEYSAKRDALNKEQQRVMQERTAETAKMRKDIADMVIDPSHYWTDKNIGQKISAAVSVFLSGLGAGAQGKNGALAVIEKGIEQDIDVQKANLGKKQSLLSNYLAETGDIREAQKMATANLMDVAGMQLKLGAARSGSEQAKTAAEIAAAELMQKADALKMSYDFGILSAKHQQSQLELSRNIANAQLQAQAQMKAMAKYANVQQLGVKMLDGSVRVSQTQNDHKETQQRLESARTVHAQLDQLRELAKNDPHGIWNMISKKYNEAGTLEAAFVAHLTKANERGNTSDRDREVYKQMLGSIRGFNTNPQAYTARLDALENSLDAAVEATVAQRTWSLDEYLNLGSGGCASVSVGSGGKGGGKVGRMSALPGKR